ncbi:MAG: hypothetical protein R2932_05645 [Caldilineaceae bacterium]
MIVRMESLKIAQEVQRAVFQTAAVEVGALGLGAVLVAILQGVWLDMTGILGASAVAALGLYVLPYKRNQVKAELRRQAAELRAQLNMARSVDNLIMNCRKARLAYRRRLRPIHGLCVWSGRSSKS